MSWCLGVLVDANDSAVSHISWERLALNLIDVERRDFLAWRLRNDHGFGRSCKIKLLYISKSILLTNLVILPDGDAIDMGSIN